MRAEDFVSLVARLRTEEEMEKTGHPWENDDVWSVLHDLIHTARRIETESSDTGYKFESEDA